MQKKGTYLNIANKIIQKPNDSIRSFWKIAERLKPQKVCNEVLKLEETGENLQWSAKKSRKNNLSAFP